MPTKGGKPKAGDFMVYRYQTVDRQWHEKKFKVIDRTTGEYYALRVRYDGEDKEQLMVDAPYLLQQGIIRFSTPADIAPKDRDPLTRMLFHYLSGRNNVLGTSMEETPEGGELDVTLYLGGVMYEYKVLVKKGWNNREDEAD